LDDHNGGLEAQMEPWRVYRIVNADSHNFEEELDPVPHESEKLDPDTQPWFQSHVLRNTMITGILVNFFILI
jgi:hypothetical protein